MKRTVNLFINCLSANALPTIGLGVVLQLTTLSARADLSYADMPLQAGGGPIPNVALLLDNSSSMGATDTGGTGSFISVCDGTTVLTQPLSRLDAEKEAACQAVIDNSAGMRIALYTFTGGTTGTAIQVTPFTVNNQVSLRANIKALAANQSSQLSTALKAVASDFAGVGTNVSPIQYRCQKNYTLQFSDSLPSVTQDIASVLSLPVLSPAQTSPWAGSNTTASPGWDGFPDPAFLNGSITVYPWLDDFSQWAYDVDMKTTSSPGVSPSFCGTGGSTTPGVAGKDCANQSWDMPDFPKQNMITYMMGYGAETHGENIRDAVLNDRIPLNSSNVFPVVSGANPADTIYIPSHGRLTGDWAHYYSQTPNPLIGGLYAYEVDNNALKTTVTAVAPATTASAVRTFTVASTSGWTSSNPVTFLNIKFTAPYVPTINLVNGQDYYPVNITATTFQLANTPGGVAIATTCSSTCAVNDFRFIAYPRPAVSASDRGKYWITRIDNDHIKLALTKNESALCATDASKCVDITNTGYGFLSVGPGRAYYSETSAQLSGAVKSAFDSIRADASMVVKANSAQLVTGTYLYQAQFNTSDWSGDVSAYAINPVTGLPSATPDWIASTQVTTYLMRKIFTWNGISGVNFSSVPGLTAAQQISLGSVTADRQKVLDWVLGKDDVALAGSRLHGSSLYGDILDSNPDYVAQPNNNYDVTLPASVPDASTCSGLLCTGKESYTVFKTITRTPMLYVGANDGMLHGINANTGSEVMGFIPNGVYTDWADLNNNGVMDAGTETTGMVKKFYELVQGGYGQSVAQPHRYFVDGEPNTGDAFYAGSWHTVLVGGLGRGGRSVYAIDVTNPNIGFTASNILWEFNDNNSGNMGYSYSRPVITRLQNGQWAAIFGNGYDGANDVGRLFIVNLQTGALIKRIDLASPTAGVNGLSSVSVWKDGAGTATTVYAGDLKGNVWKFDISANNPASWPSVINTPLFIARDQLGNVQPISSAITLASNTITGSGVMLYVGTGTYFQNGDISYVYPGSAVKNDTMYGLWDNGSANINSNKSELVQQTIGSTVVGGLVYRTASANLVNYAFGQRGWYIDLVEGGAFQGERVSNASVISDSGLVFSTVIPRSDPCSRASGAYMIVDALSGGQVATPVFDTNLDGVIDMADISVAGMVDAGGFHSVYDNDGVPAALDNCPFVSNVNQLDVDGDGIGDACDLDSDNDGVLDINDAFPLDPAEWLDTDGDGIGNNADWDDDGDGVPDTVDAAPLDGSNATEIIFPLDGIYQGKVLESQQQAQ